MIYSDAPLGQDNLKTNDCNHGGDGEVKKSRMVMPEGRTTLFALGVALGLVAAGSVAWYLSKRRQY